MPVGGVPGKTCGIGDGIKVGCDASNVGTNVGDSAAVGKPKAGGVEAGKLESPSGVEVVEPGTGRFCNMKNNQAAIPQRVSTPQPNPPKRRISRTGRSFFGDCINSKINHKGHAEAT